MENTSQTVKSQKDEVKRYTNKTKNHRKSKMFFFSMYKTWHRRNGEWGEKKAK